MNRQGEYENQLVLLAIFLMTDADRAASSIDPAPPQGGIEKIADLTNAAVWRAHRPPETVARIPATAHRQSANFKTKLLQMRGIGTVAGCEVSLVASGWFGKALQHPRINQ